MKRERKALIKKLDNIALGLSFHMDALEEAEKISWLDMDDKAVLRRYRNGNQYSMDHIALQAVAMKLRGN
jgi:hypothetical protein